MPLYLCNSLKGSVPKAAKAKLAEEITEIHCRLTGAPKTFVHLFFLEQAQMPPLENNTLVLMGSVRHGRSNGVKRQLKTQIMAAIVEHTGIAPECIHATLLDVPASWVMEGGEVLPEPGDEQHWLNLHQS